MPEPTPLRLSSSEDCFRSGVSAGLLGESAEVAQGAPGLLWKRYRQDHPQQMERNRRQQRLRDQKRQLANLANNNLAFCQVLIFHSSTLLGWRLQLLANNIPLVPPVPLVYESTYAVKVLRIARRGQPPEPTNGRCSQCAIGAGLTRWVPGTRNSSAVPARGRLPHPGCTGRPPPRSQPRLRLLGFATIRRGLKRQFSPRLHQGQSAQR
jgi:hypothetical protein